MASITITWSANPATDNIIAYDIYGANGTSVAFGSTSLLASINALTWTDIGLPNNQARTYYVVARNTLGSSAPDGPLNITSAAASGVYVQNAGAAPSLQEGLHSARPAAGTANRLYLETDTKALFRDNGASWDGIGSAPGLTDSHIFVGDASNDAADVAMSGDATISNTGAVTVSAIGGVVPGTAAFLASDTDGTLAANSDSRLATQKATKTYIDTKVAGLSWKQAVRAATTANGTLATAFANGQTIDGVTLATADRILIKNQSTGADNGIYIVAASGAPARATDADAGSELVNATMYVSEGTTLADTQWTCTTNAPITIGSTSLAFAQLTSGGGAVSSVFGRTGAVIAATNDYSFSQISGVAAAAQLPPATSSTPGAVQPDNTSITVSAGVLSAAGFVPAAAAFHPGFQTARLYTTPLDSATQRNMAANVLIAIPFYVPVTTTFTKIAVRVTTGAVGTHVDLGIYANNNGIPGTLILDAGPVATATSSTTASITISQTLQPGWYWPACWCDGAPTLQAGSTGPFNFFLGFDTSSNASQSIQTSVTYSANNLPNPFSPIAYSNTAPFLVFLIK